MLASSLLHYSASLSLNPGCYLLWNERPIQGGSRSSLAESSLGVTPVPKGPIPIEWGQVCPGLMSPRQRPLDFMLGLWLETSPVLISCVQSIRGSSGICLLNTSCTLSFLYYYCCSPVRASVALTSAAFTRLPWVYFLLYYHPVSTGNRNIFLL